MKTLSQAELLASDVVANATMNRGRGLSGVNSYARELRFDVPAFLQERVEARGRAFWYDPCCGQGCGQGRALAEAGEQFAATDWGQCVRIVGVDLIGDFVPAGENVRLLAGDVLTWTLEGQADLITCVHGLHYLGDKLGFLERAYAQLALGGILLAHLDTANLRQPYSWTQTVRRLRAQGIRVTWKDHRQRLERTDAPLAFGLTYTAATISAQANYTGITVVDSWYQEQGPGD